MSATPLWVLVSMQKNLKASAGDNWTSRYHVDAVSRLLDYPQPKQIPPALKPSSLIAPLSASEAAHLAVAKRFQSSELQGADP